jgi:membrane-bound acyltransferase YfiQ involved in biofilm formation
MLFVLAVRPLVGTTIWLYVFHGAAFPIGVIAAHLLTHVPRKPLATLVRPEIRAIIVLVCAVIAAYTAVRSDVGQWDEQIVSMVTVLSLCGLFAFLPVRFALLDLFGAFAFEIYLFHWPLMYRYDILFRVLSPAAATLAYLGVFIAGGWLLQQCSAPLIKRWTGKGA